MFLYRPLLEAPKIKTALKASSFFFLPKVRECCLPRTSEGRTRGEHSDGLELYLCSLNVKVEQISRQMITLFFPSNKVCISDTLSAMIEILNALSVQGSVLGNGDREISKTGYALLMKSAGE